MYCRIRLKMRNLELWHQFLNAVFLCCSFLLRIKLKLDIEIEGCLHSNSWNYSSSNIVVICPICPHLRWTHSVLGVLYDKKVNLAKICMFHCRGVGIEISTCGMHTNLQFCYLRHINYFSKKLFWKWVIQCLQGAP